jgi:hypothetical protein
MIWFNFLGVCPDGDDEMTDDPAGHQRVLLVSRRTVYALAYV